jgi:type III pantothenate kinase
LRQAFFIVRLLLDFGNTRAKAALFDKEEIVWVKTILASEESEWKEIFLREDIQAAMISASGDIPKVWNQFFQGARFPVHFLKSDDPLPFINAYTTPSTLGLDRLANVAAAQVFCPNQHSLVIDAGTCITYDFLENGSVYRGGIISPGWKMRLKSMHHFTARLPEVDGISTDLLGSSTLECMQSGAFYGLLAEIRGIINSINQRFDDVQVFITGGDMNTLQNHLENSIFARPHLQLEGLNQLLKYHLGES